MTQKRIDITTPPGFAPPGFAYDAAYALMLLTLTDGLWVRYQYDQAGRLVKVTHDSGKSLEQYAYGADRRRLQKTNSEGSTYYFWDGSRVIAEYNQPTAESEIDLSKSHIYLGSRSPRRRRCPSTPPGTVRNDSPLEEGGFELVVPL